MHHHIPFKMFYPIVRYIWFTHAHYIHIYIYIYTTPLPPIYIIQILSSHTHTYIYIYLLLLLCTYIYFTFNHIYIYILYIYNISLTRRQSWVRQTPPSSSPRGCGTWTASHGCGPAPGPRSRCGGSSRRRWPSSGPFGGGHGSGLTRGVGKNDEELGWEINSI